MDDKLIGIPDEIVLNKIYLIRGQKVMLDFDLSALYGVETRALKQAVKRNSSRFPQDFVFQLTKEEWQEVITNCDNLPKTAKFSPTTPLAFCDYGVLMLSSVLNSSRAIDANIQIIRIFTRLRNLIIEQDDWKTEIVQIKKKLSNHDKNMELVFSYLDELMVKKSEPRKRIGYKPDDL